MPGRRVGAGGRRARRPISSPPRSTWLKEYLAQGRQDAVLLDPPDRPEAPPLTNLIALAKDWGIDVGTNIVVDVSGMGQLLGTDVSVPVAAKYEPHPITDRFSLMTAYPLARSVRSIAGGGNGHSAQNLVDTSKNSWAESDIKGLLTLGRGRRASSTRGTSRVRCRSRRRCRRRGRRARATPAGAGAEADDAPKPETRIAVFGDSDFVTNGYLGIPGNTDLFLNTVNWLAQQENLISIRPKEPEDRRSR